MEEFLLKEQKSHPCYIIYHSVSSILQIKQIFTNVGVDMDNDSFQQMWNLAASKSDNGQVSVESFRNVLDEVQTQKIAESAWWCIYHSYFDVLNM